MGAKSTMVNSLLYSFFHVYLLDYKSVICFCIHLYRSRKHLFWARKHCFRHRKNWMFRAVSKYKPRQSPGFEKNGTRQYINSRRLLHRDTACCEEFFSITHRHCHASTMVDRVEQYQREQTTREQQLHIEAAARQLETLARLEEETKRNDAAALQQYQQQRRKQLPRQHFLLSWRRQQRMIPTCFLPDHKHPSMRALACFMSVHSYRNPQHQCLVLLLHLLLLFPICPYRVAPANKLLTVLVKHQRKRYPLH
jgi:hypothetical protein